MKEDDLTGLKPWGEGDLMAVAAFRYCLGRRTYIVGTCTRWLGRIWLLLKPLTRTLILRELEEAVARDDEARSRGDRWRPLGDDCDREKWLSLYEQLKASGGERPQPEGWGDMENLTDRSFR